MSSRMWIAAGISVLCHGVILALLYQPATPAVRLPTLEVVLAGAVSPQTREPERIDAGPGAPTKAPPTPEIATRTPDNSIRSQANAPAAGELTRAVATNDGPPADQILRPDYSRPLSAPDQTTALTPAARAKAAEPPATSGIVLAIRQRLARFQTYPPAARRRGLEGAATVRFVIRRDGQLVTKSLLQSSGSPHLDQAALKLVSDAAPYPELPVSVSGDRLEVQIPIDYRLNRPAT